MSLVVKIGSDVSQATAGIRAVKTELATLPKATNAANLSVGKLTGGIRTLANILPGVGMAGLFTLAFVGVEKLIGGVGRLTAEQQKLKKITDSLGDSIAGELSKLTTLVGVIQNANTSSEDRVRALRAINEEYGKYLPGLDKEKISLENISKAYDEITKSLLNQAVVKGAQKEIEEIVSKTAASIVKIQLEEEKLNQKRQIAPKFQKVQTDALKLYNTNLRDGQLANIEYGKELTRAAGDSLTFEGRVKTLTQRLKEQLTPLLNLTSKFGDLGLKDPKNKTEVQGKIKAQIEEIIKALPVLDVPVRVQITIDRFQDVALDKIPKTFKQKFEEKLNKDLSGIVIKPDFKGKFTNEEAFKKLQEDAKKRLQELQVIGAGIAEVMRSAFDGLFTSIEKGANAIDGFFKGMVDGIKQVVKQLITAAAIAGILSLLGLGSFMTLFKGIVGLPGRAAGGPVSGGQPYVVGEQGRELFVPSTSGRIISNNQLNGLNGAAMQMVRVVVEGQISGRNINLVQTRQNRYDSTNV